jgi:hypothetical protein
MRRPETFGRNSSGTWAHADPGSQWMLHLLLGHAGESLRCKALIA